ncbi:FG-GAP-like repeat-containing protein [Terracoccus sp. 273MFTsu3.1]|uniref:FG-GAP-like repeat-containing protein n=1 Tax=Terracoccus sp. 273MFTsu3.1 TaxID=1172188 RepID=UPI000362E13B|nr:FG-GAP-like repeat-containing protein [Terracoccus sp. 273MFTsu3.1]
MTVSAPSAWATDDVSPRIDTISFTSAPDVSPGDPVTISYSVTDASSTVSIVASFVDGAGRRTEWDFGSHLPLSGVASSTVPDGLADVPTSLLLLTVTDESGNSTEYRAHGMTCDPACPGATHDLSFATTLTVTGSTPDEVAPVVTSLALAAPSVAVGTPARLALDVDEAHPPVTSLASMAYAVFTNGSYSFRLTGDPTAFGSVGGVVPTSVPNGPYRLDSVYVRDLAGNTATYRASGSVQVWPQGSAGGPTTHTLPFASTTVTVTGSSVDVTSPVLSRLAWMTRPTTSGSTGTLSYGATDEALASVTIHYQSSTGFQTPLWWELTSSLTGPGTGVTTARLPSMGTGSWVADSVVLRDAVGNYSEYDRGGMLSCNRACATTHAIDLSTLDLAVIAAPTAPSYLAAVPLDRSLRAQWDPPSETGNSAVTGYAVTVSPGGRTYTVGGSARSLTVTGLADHTAYTVSVRARNAAGLGPARAAKATTRPRQRLFITTDVSNDGRADIVGVTHGNVAYLYRGNGRGGITGSTKVGSGLGDVRTLLPALAKPTDDFFGGNVLSVSYTGTDESWWAYNGNRLVPFNSISPSTFNAYRHIVTPGDVNGDAKADVLTIADNGDMYLWANRDWARFWGPRKIGSGWQSYTTVVGVGDLDGDRRDDLVARRSDGTLWFYGGTGTAGFRARTQIGTSKGWNGFTQLAGMADFTGDGRKDLLALAPNGYLYVFTGTGTGRGGFTSRILVSKGFGSFI